MLRREPEEVFCPQLLQLRYAAQFGTNPTWKEAARSAELCLCFRLERGVQKGIVIPFDRHDAAHAAWMVGEGDGQ